MDAQKPFRGYLYGAYLHPIGGAYVAVGKLFGRLTSEEFEPHYIRTSQIVRAYRAENLRIILETLDSLYGVIGCDDILKVLEESSLGVVV